MTGGFPDPGRGKVSVGGGWAHMRQDCDLSIWYLEVGLDIRGFDSEKEELLGEAGRCGGGCSDLSQKTSPSPAPSQSWKRAILVTGGLCGPQMNVREPAG